MRGGRSFFWLAVLASAAGAVYAYRADLEAQAHKWLGLPGVAEAPAAARTPPSGPAPAATTVPVAAATNPAPAGPAEAHPSATLLAAQPTVDPSAGLTILVEHPITLFNAGVPTEVALSVKTSPFAAEKYTWKPVPDTLNPLNGAGTVTFSTNDSDSPRTMAAFPGRGVYEIELTAAKGEATATRCAWVNVWDDETIFTGKGRLGLNPGIAPPTSVRQLSPTPPAYAHPRLLFTAADWTEMAQRDSTGIVGRWGVARIRKEVAETLDNPKDPTGQFAAALDAWVRGGMQGPGPDAASLGKTGILASEARGCFYSMLVDAAYLLWLEEDPSQPATARKRQSVDRGEYLARLAAGAARLHFSALWNRVTGKFNLQDGPLMLRNFDQPGRTSSGPDLCDLGVAYDLLYNWMDKAQRSAVRDFLYAAQWGRHSSYGAWNDDGTLRPGRSHNGDFGNLNDHVILEALAIEGEEASVSPEVHAAFGVPKPGSPESRWMKMAEPQRPGGVADGNGGLGGKPAPADPVDGGLVPHAMGHGREPPGLPRFFGEEYAAVHPCVRAARGEPVGYHDFLPGGSSRHAGAARC